MERWSGKASWRRGHLTLALWKMSRSGVGVERGGAERTSQGERGWVHLENFSAPLQLQGHGESKGGLHRLRSSEATPGPSQMSSRQLTASGAPASVPWAQGWAREQRTGTL